MNIDIQAELVNRLKKKKWHISFAESCTGGLAAAGIIDIPDASAVIDASFVTYSNEAKIKYLGVKKSTLDCYGAVSEQVAGEMAQGAARANNAEVGVGISGIAGPGGATDAKPVGTVCFGFYIDGRLFTETAAFPPNGRNFVRRSSVELVFRRLLEYII